MAGVTFRPGYPDNLLNLHPLVEEAKAASLGWGNNGDGNMGMEQVQPGLPVILVRDSDNEYDEWAVEIHVPSLGRGRSHIGFVPAELSQKIGPSMDDGDEWTGTLVSVYIDPEHPLKPGAEVVATLVAAFT